MTTLTLTLDLTEQERRDLIAMVHAYDTGFPVADRTGDFVLNQRSKDIRWRFHEIAKRIKGALTEPDTITCRDDMVYLQPGSVIARGIPGAENLAVATRMSNGCWLETGIADPITDYADWIGAVIIQDGAAA